MAGSDRLDSVRLRIGIPTDQTATALRRLATEQFRPASGLVHLLDYPVGTGPPGMGTDLVVAVRTTEDVSRLWVRIHHVSRLRLVGRWAQYRDRHDAVLRVEEERNAVRRELTASLSGPGDHVLELVDRGADIRHLLSADQLAFVQDCAATRLPPGPLVAYGPVRALGWPVAIDAQIARVRRWRYPADPGSPEAVDLVEVSACVLASEAGFLVPVLAGSLRRRGIDPDLEPAWLEERALTGIKSRPVDRS